MPGLVGLVTDQDRTPPAATVLAPMIDAMVGDAQAQPRWIYDDDPRLAVGWTGHVWHDQSDHVAFNDGSFIVLHGEVHRLPPSQNADEKASCNGTSGVAAKFLTGYLLQGTPFLADVEGHFAAVIWDARRRRCALITDKFASQPLYISHEQGRLAFASTIRALLCLPHLSRTICKQGLVEFFAFGHLWNHHTLFESIHCFDAATVLEIDDQAQVVSREQYWRPAPGRRNDLQSSLEAVDEALTAAVADRVQGNVPLGLSLSGGLDARTILAVMDHEKVSPKCLCMGMEGSLDQVSSARLAQMVRCEYHSYVLDERFLVDFERHLLGMVELTDGHYLSQCIVMPTLPTYERLGIRALLRGHAGELMHMRKAYNFSIDGSVSDLQTDSSLQAWLLNRLQAHLTDNLEGPLIRGLAAAEFAQLAEGALLAAMTKTSQWEDPVDRIGQLFLDQRIRRETAMSLQKFGSVVDVRAPYLDGRVTEALLSCPPQLRLGDDLQTFILRKHRPEFLAPLNSNTGAPVGAGAWRRNFGVFRMRILAKLGVKGFQPYERLGLWLRRELRPTVERILLDPRCLERGLLEPDTVRGVLRRHFQGAQNHTFLIMALLALEIGFRRFLDGATSRNPVDCGPVSETMRRHVDSPRTHATVT
jgi:asparagine synthetase B (glutamine-hydrolysing)